MALRRPTLGVVAVTFIACGVAGVALGVWFLGLQVRPDPPGVTIPEGFANALWRGSMEFLLASLVLLVAGIGAALARVRQKKDLQDKSRNEESVR
jgi:hypothetical protein